MRGTPCRWGTLAGLLGVALTVLSPALIAAAAPTQEVGASPDTIGVFELGSIVVTADRAATPLEWSTGSVSILRGSELRTATGIGLAGALRRVPGFAFLPFDGLGHDPQATVRGFYGGGETDYVLVLLDGRPVNRVESGSFNWNRVPLAAVESVEVLRGGASSLYGDAAMGGVVNLVTRQPFGEETEVDWTVAGGSHGSYSGDVAAAGAWNERAFTAFGGLERTDGYRDHAERTVGAAGGSITLAERAGRRLVLSGLAHWRSFDLPGPLTAGALAVERNASAPFFRFDHTDEESYRVALDAARETGSGLAIDVSLAGEGRWSDAVRTLPLSADFADTQERDLTVLGLTTSAQLTAHDLAAAGDRAVVGVDASLGTLDSEYFVVAGGTAEDYRNASGERGALDARGEGRRVSTAAFLQYDLRLLPALKLSLGARLDALWDASEPDALSGGGRLTTNHIAFSPKAGVNVRYAEGGPHTGHWYANVARSFKAPTLDQLYDLRGTPVPFEPFRITISNGDLEPQSGTSYETGVYHRVGRPGAGRVAEISLSVYQLDMKDEIDFDIQTFGFRNIAESRHRGLEAGLRVGLGAGVAAHLAYTRQDVTARTGPFQGKALKAIPRDHLAGGVSGGMGGALDWSVSFASAQRMYLDDANQRRIPDYTTIDVRLGLNPPTAALAGLSLFVEVANLLDEQYSSTGFPDPAGSEVDFFHPAAGRTARIGVRIGSRARDR